jgi:hypothetical protein
MMYNVLTMTNSVNTMNSSTYLNNGVNNCQQALYKIDKLLILLLGMLLAI